MHVQASPLERCTVLLNENRPCRTDHTSGLLTANAVGGYVLLKKCQISQNNKQKLRFYPKIKNISFNFWLNEIGFIIRANVKF